MCIICENYKMGDRINISFEKVNLSCCICGALDSIKIVAPIWVRDETDRNNFLMHLTDYVHTCKKCSESIIVGIHCTGIDGGELFVSKKEKIEDKNTL